MTLPQPDVAVARRTARPAKPRVLSSFERLPAPLFYLPVAVWWALLSLRYRSLTLPTLANTSIRAGGLCGESKSAVLDILGPQGRAHMARFATISHAVRDSEKVTRNRVRVAMEAAAVAFPIVAKPDIGRNGRGVRKIASMDELVRYLSHYRVDTKIILQEFSPWIGEAGVFYVRYPHEPHGRITSLTLKYFPTVTGNGRTTLRDLVLADPRAGQVPGLYFPHLEGQLDDIPEMDEVVPLVFTGNHCRGAIFRDGQAHITPRMTAIFDQISQEIDGFYFGRFDLRYHDLAGLKHGQGFTIIELNGAGAEATHIWDADTPLPKAYGSLFRQFLTAFRIGNRVRRETGRKPTGALRLLKLYRRELRLMRHYPSE